MRFSGIIKIRGRDGKNAGYFVPRLYKMPFIWRELKHVGLLFAKERLAGWTLWICDESDYDRVTKALDELKKTRIFEYKVLLED
jgi:hypothetical protein